MTFHGWKSGEKLLIGRKSTSFQAVPPPHMGLCLACLSKIPFEKGNVRKKVFSDIKFLSFLI